MERWASSFVQHFAEITDEVGRRLHIGCILAAGSDWVEVSLPEDLQLAKVLQVRFLPSQITHEVEASWRRKDRVGFTYLKGGPPEDQFAGITGLLDPRPAALRRRS